MRLAIAKGRHTPVEDVSTPEATPDPHLERKRLRTLLLRAGLLFVALVGVIVAMVWFAGDLPRTADGTIDFSTLLGAARDSRWAALIVVASYVVLNFTGVPQFMLVGATVLVFGPLAGFVYAWIGTMVSSSVGFFLGYGFGGELLRRFGGSRANRISTRLAQHGVLTSAAVRIVPAGPAIMVNMALGLSHISYAKFFLGTALGIAPKIALIALVGEGLQGLLSGGNLLWLVVIAAIVVLWIGAMVVVKRRITKWRAQTDGGAGEPVAGVAVAVPNATLPQ